MNNFLKEMSELIKHRVSQMSDYPVPNKNAHDFLTIFNNKQHPIIISEIKFSSPSLGTLYQGEYDHVDIAKAYLQSGADALSILTEPHHFKGDINYINNIRQVFMRSHLLLKDFVISKKQIRQAAHFGANAILLIKAMISNDNLAVLYDYALSLGLTPIIEVHDLTELMLVSRLSPKIIGINNRSLKTLTVDVNTSRELISHVPAESYVISESGIQTRAEIEELHALGFDGFLIGSSLMTSADPGEALKELLTEVSIC